MDVIRSVTLTLITFSMVLALGGCDVGEGRGSGRVVVTDTAGTSIIESLTPEWSQGEAWRISLEPMIDIGVVDGPAEYALDQVRDVRSLPGGRIIVANGGTLELRFYDQDGSHVRSVGGEGDGPGEFRDFSGVTVVGDSVLVYDPRLGRLSTFDTAGEYRGSIRLGPTDDALYTAGDYRLAGSLPDQRLLFLPYAYNSAPKPVATLYWDSAANLVYDLRGALLDTLGGFSGMDMYGDPEVGTQVRLGAYTVADVHAGRLYIGHGHEYTIDVYGPDGSLERVIRRRAEPVEADEALRQERLDWLLSLADNETQRQAFRREHREDVESGRFAEALPFYSYIVVAERGGLWVQRYRVRWSDGPHAWDVFDDAGRWLGTLYLPEGYRVHEVGADYLLGVGRDDLNVEYVQMYRLIK